jgi:hypothetical protein
LFSLEFPFHNNSLDFTSFNVRAAVVYSYDILTNLERDCIRDLLLKPTHPPNMHCLCHSAKFQALYVRNTGPVDYSQTSQHLKIASTTAYLEPGPLPLFQRLDVPR